MHKCPTGDPPALFDAIVVCQHAQPVDLALPGGMTAGGCWGRAAMSRAITDKQETVSGRLRE